MTTRFWFALFGVRVALCCMFRFGCFRRPGRSLSSSACLLLIAVSGHWLALPRATSAERNGKTHKGETERERERRRERQQGWAGARQDTLSGCPPLAWQQRRRKCLLQVARPLLLLAIVLFGNIYLFSLSFPLPRLPPMPVHRVVYLVRRPRQHGSFRRRRGTRVPNGRGSFPSPLEYSSGTAGSQVFLWLMFGQLVVVKERKSGQSRAEQKGAKSGRPHRAHGSMWPERSKYPCNRNIRVFHPSDPCPPSGKSVPAISGLTIFRRSSECLERPVLSTPRIFECVLSQISGCTCNVWSFTEFAVCHPHSSLLNYSAEQDVLVSPGGTAPKKFMGDNNWAVQLNPLFSSASDSGVAPINPRYVRVSCLLVCSLKSKVVPRVNKKT